MRVYFLGAGRHFPNHQEVNPLLTDGSSTDSQGPQLGKNLLTIDFNVSNDLETSTTRLSQIKSFKDMKSRYTVRALSQLLQP